MVTTNISAARTAFRTARAKAGANPAAAEPEVRDIPAPAWVTRGEILPVILEEVTAAAPGLDINVADINDILPAPAPIDIETFLASETIALPNVCQLAMVSQAIPTESPIEQEWLQDVFVNLNVAAPPATGLQLTNVQPTQTNLPMYVLPDPDLAASNFAQGWSTMTNRISSRFQGRLDAQSFIWELTRTCNGCDSWTELQEVLLPILGPWDYRLGNPHTRAGAQILKDIAGWMMEEIYLVHANETIRGITDMRARMVRLPIESRLPLQLPVNLGNQRGNMELAPPPRGPAPFVPKPRVLSLPRPTHWHGH